MKIKFAVGKEIRILTYARYFVFDKKMYTEKKIKIRIYICGIVGTSILVYTSFHMHSRNQELKNIFLIQKEILLNKSNNKNIENARQISNAYIHYQKGRYAQALVEISGTLDQDYYNRGTIKTKRAYDEAIKTGFSNLIHAQELLLSAQKDFSIAKRLTKSKELYTIISKNDKEIQQAYTIVNTKTCYIGAEKNI